MQKTRIAATILVLMAAIASVGMAVAAPHPTCRYEVLQTCQGQQAYRVYEPNGTLGIQSERHGIPIECCDDQWFG